MILDDLRTIFVYNIKPDIQLEPSVYINQITLIRSMIFDEMNENCHVCK